MTRSFGRALFLETRHLFLRETLELMETADENHRVGLVETIAPFFGAGQGEP